MTTDEIDRQLATLRSTDLGPRKGSTPNIQFFCPYEEGECHVPIATMAEEASRLTHDRSNSVDREAMKYDACVFAARLYDLADAGGCGPSRRHCAHRHLHGVMDAAHAPRRHAPDSSARP